MNFDEIIRNAIRNPTPDAAAEVFSEVIIPDPRLESVITPIVEKVFNGAPSDVVAKEALDSIFDVVEDIVLEEGVDFVTSNFGDRIVDFVISNLASVIERTVMMLTGAG